MVNKKGYIKTLEAVIAIIMIIVVGYMLIPRPMETPTDVPLIVKGSQNIIDQSIQFNETLRELITKKDTLQDLTEEERWIVLDGTKNIIDRHIPAGYDYTCAVCTNPGTCLACTPLEKSTYMADVLVASSGEQQNPKIVRVWFWKKPTPPAKDWPERDQWLGKCCTNVPCEPPAPCKL